MSTKCNLLTIILPFFVIGFLLTGCTCRTIFTPITINATGNEYKLTAQIREGSFDKEPDQLEIDFIFCSFPSSVSKCNDKTLVANSLKIIPAFGEDKEELLLIKEYASTFYYGSQNFNTTWRKKDTLFIKINYQVDSLKTILTREDDYLLVKDKDCRFKFVLH